MLRWLKDGVELGSSALVNGSLSLGGLAGEAGTYQCTASAPGIGTLISRAAKVTFAGKEVFVL